jgi:hypothetical protein
MVDNSKKKVRPRPVPQPGLTEIDPTSELALIAYGELADRRTVIVDVPTNVCVLILHATAPGTVSVIGPRLVDACSDRGGTEHVAMIPPASDLRLTEAERRREYLDISRYAATHR